MVLMVQAVHVSMRTARSRFGNSGYALRHFLRHFFGSFVIRRAPPCADDARRNPLLQSTLSGTKGLFTAQDGTPAEMTLDHFVMVRIHARQLSQSEALTQDHAGRRGGR